ncbi:MAG: hypothetical protein IBJ10_06165 [Phycisphaerales bacterium]|nr:hypothetical protein [Phycisphaerales bacterium]
MHSERIRSGPAHVPRAGATLLAGAALALGGCASEGASTRGGTEMSRRMAAMDLRLDTLQELNFAFADRYMTTIAAACDGIIANNPDPAQRAAAARIKISYVTSIYDVVTSHDPVSQVVDLALVVTLQSQVFIDDGRADDLFGDRADPLVFAIRRSREEIWDLAGRLFNAEDQDHFDRVIWNWRKQNAHLDFVGLVRFDEFATDRAKAIINEVKRGGGFFAPVDDARRAVEEARLFGERVFFMAKRMPTILEWQVMAAGDGLLSHPEVTRMTDAHASMAPALSGVSTSLDELSAELDTQRRALLEGVDERIAGLGVLLKRSEQALESVRALVEQVEPALAAGTALTADLRAAADSLRESAATADQIVRRVTVPPDDPRFRPFDINEYAAAASNLAEAARELQATLERTDRMLAADSLDSTIQKHRAALIADASSLIDRAFWRLAALIGLAFVLMAGLRALGAKTRRARKPDDPARRQS